MGAIAVPEKKKETYWDDNPFNPIRWGGREILVARPVCFSFFFSSRRRHTRWLNVTEFRRVLFRSRLPRDRARDSPRRAPSARADSARFRSEERRVGKSVLSRVDLGGCRIIKKKKIMPRLLLTLALFILCYTAKSQYKNDNVLYKNVYPQDFCFFFQADDGIRDGSM